MHFVDAGVPVAQINHKCPLGGVWVVGLAAIGEHEAVLLLDCLEYLERGVGVDLAVAENGPHEQRARQFALDLQFGEVSSYAGCTAGCGCSPARRSNSPRLAQPTHF
jgi:hypothetical protein